MADIRRMNVSLTRAKFALYIVGNVPSLTLNHHWKSLVEDASKRSLCKCELICFLCLVFSIEDEDKFWSDNSKTAPVTPSKSILEGKKRKLDENEREERRTSKTKNFHKVPQS